MRKIVGLAIVLMLFALSVAPISAQTQPRVIMHGSASQVEFPPGVDANVVVHVDTASGMVRLQVSHPGGFVGPGGEFITGRYAIGEVTGWIIDGTTVTIDAEGQMYLLPSREPHGPSGPGQFVVGELTGPGNRGYITILGWLTIPGTIIIR